MWARYLPTNCRVSFNEVGQWYSVRQCLWSRACRRLPLHQSSICIWHSVAKSLSCECVTLWITMIDIWQIFLTKFFDKMTLNQGFVPTQFEFDKENIKPSLPSLSLFLCQANLFPIFFCPTFYKFCCAELHFSPLPWISIINAPNFDFPWDKEELRLGWQHLEITSVDKGW